MWPVRSQATHYGNRLWKEMPYLTDDWNLAQAFMKVLRQWAALGSIQGGQTPPEGPQTTEEVRDVMPRVEVLLARLDSEVKDPAPSLRPQYPGPWNLASASGLAVLVEGDPVRLLALIQQGKAIGCRVLGGHVHSSAAIRLSSSIPVSDTWTYPRLERAIQEGRVIRLDPPRPDPPKPEPLRRP